MNRHKDVIRDAARALMTSIIAFRIVMLLYLRFSSDSRESYLVHRRSEKVVIRKFVTEKVQEKPRERKSFPKRQRRML